MEEILYSEENCCLCVRKLTKQDYTDVCSDCLECCEDIEKWEVFHEYSKESCDYR